MSEGIGPLSPPGQAKPPARVSLHGQYTSVIPIDASHTVALNEEIGGPANHHLWSLIPFEQPADEQEFAQRVQQWRVSSSQSYYVVCSAPASVEGSRPLGILDYTNIVPEHRRIEIGSIILGAKLKRTRQATEAFYLLMKHAFEDLGYLRFEWKADQRNSASMAAARRLGFTYEGTFRKHMVVKGRRRDTAWFSITDDEWPAIKRGFEAWLHPDNFDEEGKQRRTLSECRDGLSEAQDL